MPCTTEVVSVLYPASRVVGLSDQHHTGDNLGDFAAIVAKSMPLQSSTLYPVSPYSILALEPYRMLWYSKSHNPVTLVGL